MPGARDLLPPLPRAAWVVLAGDALSSVGSGLTLPFFFVYLNRIRGIDVEVAGFAVATIALAGFPGNPVGGWLADRVGPKRALVFGLVAAAAGALVVTLVRHSWQGFAAAALVGFGAAVIWPAEDSLLATVVDTDQRSSVFSVRYAALNAGYGVGALVGAAIVDLSSPSSFVVLYLIDALSFLLFIPVLVLGLRGVGGRPPARVGAGEHGVPARGFRVVLRDPVFVRLWLLTAALVAAGYAQTHSGFPAYATTVGRISAAGLSLVWAANTFAVVLAQLIVLRWMRGRRRTTGLALVCTCWAAAWAITLAAGVLNGGAVAVAAFAVAFVVFGIGETLLSPSLAPMVNDLAADDVRGRYNGAFTLAWTTGFAVGPVVAGVAFRLGSGRVYFAGLVVVLLGLAVAAARLTRSIPEAVNRVPVPAPVVPVPAKDLS